MDVILIEIILIITAVCCDRFPRWWRMLWFMVTSLWEKFWNTANGSMLNSIDTGSQVSRCHCLLLTGDVDIIIVDLYARKFLARSFELVAPRVVQPVRGCCKFVPVLGGDGTRR